MNAFLLVLGVRGVFGRSGGLSRGSSAFIASEFQRYNHVQYRRSLRLGSSVMYTCYQKGIVVLEVWSNFAFIIKCILGIKHIFSCSFGNKRMRLLTRVYGTACDQSYYVYTISLAVETTKYSLESQTSDHYYICICISMQSNLVYVLFISLGMELLSMEILLQCNLPALDPATVSCAVWIAKNSSNVSSLVVKSEPQLFFRLEYSEA